MALVKPEDFYSRLRSGQLKSVYILAGEETYLQEEAWRYIEKKLGVDSLNTEVFYAPEAAVSDILLAAQTQPFLAERRLIVVKDAQKYRAADVEKLASFFKHPSPSSVTVIVWGEKVRRDGKGSALLSVPAESGEVVDFRPLYDRELPAWVVRKVKENAKTIGADAVQYLVQESASNLLDLSNEIEKLVLYTGTRGEITRADVEAMSGHTRLADLNHLADAVESGNSAEALKAVERMLAEGEVPLRILSTVHRVVRRLLRAKSMLEEKKNSPQDIREELQLHPYFDRSFFPRLARFRISSLERAMERIERADLELKTSARPEQMVLEELVLALSGGK